MSSLGGTFAPGNSIGVLTAANLTLDTANLAFEVLHSRGDARLRALIRRVLRTAG